jgi:hypothetical protein
MKSSKRFGISSGFLIVGDQRIDNRAWQHADIVARAMDHPAGAARRDELRAAEVDQLFRVIGLLGSGSNIAASAMAARAPQPAAMGA